MNAWKGVLYSSENCRKKNHAMNRRVSCRHKQRHKDSTPLSVGKVASSSQLNHQNFSLSICRSKTQLLLHLFTHTLTQSLAFSLRMILFFFRYLLPFCTVRRCTSRRYYRHGGSSEDGDSMNTLLILPTILESHLVFKCSIKWMLYESLAHREKEEKNHHIFRLLSLIKIARWLVACASLLSLKLISFFFSFFLHYFIIYLIKMILLRVTFIGSNPI